MVALAACLLLSRHTAGQPPAADAVSRVGAYVERYYARAQSIIAEETVVLQPLARDLGFDGFARRLVYELRLEWDPSVIGDAGPARIVRERISASGPPLGPPDQPDCIDPRAISPEPLQFLLPERRERFSFTIAGAGEEAGRRALLIDYVPRVKEAPQVEWRTDCAHFELPGHMRGRLWVDGETWEILRVDERLTGMVDIPGPPRRRGRESPRTFTVERVDTSTRYRPVRFENPDEIVLLPERVENLTVIPRSGLPRVRVTQTFRNYRRFVTESRIVP